MTDERRPRALAAALFDMDGLLVDSEPAWTTAERTVFESLGGTWGPEVKAACIGRRLDEMAAELIRLAGSTVPVAAVAAHVEAIVTRLFAAGLAPRPGARELVDALSAEGVPLALVSSTRRGLVELALPTLGAERFRVVVTGDDVARPKPDPEPYLLAAHSLGVDPAGCVVLEDSPTGIAAGLAAGCQVIAVANSVPVQSRPGVTVLPSLAGINLGWLLAGAPAGGAARRPTIQRRMKEGERGARGAG